MATTISSADNSQTNIEQFVLMWLDTSVNSTQENLQAQQTLAKTHPQFMAFESTDECEKTIREFSDSSRVILIVSGSLGMELLPSIHNLQQLSMVYIFCMNQTKYLEWANQFAKVKYASPFTLKFSHLLSRLNPSLLTWIDLFQRFNLIMNNE